MEGHLEKYPPHSQLIHNHDAEVYAPIASCFFNFPVPVPIFIDCNFESRASRVGLHKHQKDTASVKEENIETGSSHVETS